MACVPYTGGRLKIKCTHQNLDLKTKKDKKSCRAVLSEALSRKNFCLRKCKFVCSAEKAAGIQTEIGTQTEGLVPSNKGGGGIQATGDGSLN